MGSCMSLEKAYTTEEAKKIDLHYILIPHWVKLEGCDAWYIVYEKRIINHI